MLGKDKGPEGKDDGWKGASGGRYSNIRTRKKRDKYNIHQKLSIIAYSRMHGLSLTVVNYFPCKDKKDRKQDKETIKKEYAFLISKRFGGEWLSDFHLDEMANIIRKLYSDVEGLYKTQEILHRCEEVKPIKRGLAWIHCGNHNHYILTDNLTGPVRVWDGKYDWFRDNVHVRNQMTICYGQNGKGTLKYTYQSVPEQQKGYECGDLVAARAMALMKGRSPAYIFYDDHTLLRRNTIAIFGSGEWREYSTVSFDNNVDYTEMRIKSVEMLKCCGQSKEKAVVCGQGDNDILPVVKCSHCSDIIHDDEDDNCSSRIDGKVWCNVCMFIV